ncbi:uncharacterized protein LOC122638848, partial [Telopea speciosissima]|uniref:uncharacterized protein LOC122638848 n=1 Tax=Telopea speciosissima TaxID=54955 RepID=UPI001CC63D2D
MAACDSFQHIFEKPLPENPTLIEALTQWNRHQMMKARKPIDLSSFSEIFGELHFHEKNNPTDPPPSLSPQSPFSLHSLLIEDKDANADDKEKDNPSSSSTWSSSSSSSLDAVVHHNQFEGFSIKNSESLQLCTEGLGSESADAVEDSIPNIAIKEGFDFDVSNTYEEEEEEDEETEKSSLTRNS